MMRAVPVLMYHHVSPNPGLVTVDPQTFEAHMAYLARAGYHALSADGFLAFLEGREKLSGRQILITFDDGYLDNYVYAYPVLQRYGLMATIFAITGRVGVGYPRAHAGESTTLPETPDHSSCKAAVAEGRADEVMLRWSEIEAMRASGRIEVHSHTHSHQRWDQQYPDQKQRLDALAVDLASSRAALKTHLGYESKHLCWPWGFYEPDYQSIAANTGFVAQYTTARGVNVAGGDAHCISRLVMKDRPGRWFATRVAMYQNAWLGQFYSRLRGG